MSKQYWYVTIFLYILYNLLEHVFIQESSFELDCCWITMTILDKSLKSNLYSIDGIFVHVVKENLTDFSTKRSNCYRRLSNSFLRHVFLLSFTGAEIRSVCTEAGMFAIRERRKVSTHFCFIFYWFSLDWVLTLIIF